MPEQKQRQLYKLRSIPNKTISRDSFFLHFSTINSKTFGNIEFYMLYEKNWKRKMAIFSVVRNAARLLKLSLFLIWHAILVTFIFFKLKTSDFTGGSINQQKCDKSSSISPLWTRSCRAWPDMPYAAINVLVVYLCIHNSFLLFFAPVFFFNLTWNEKKM